VFTHPLAIFWSELRRVPDDFQRVVRVEHTKYQACPFLMKIGSDDAEHAHVELLHDRNAEPGVIDRIRTVDNLYDVHGRHTALEEESCDMMSVRLIGGIEMRSKSTGNNQLATGASPVLANRSAGTPQGDRR
jgi:hypothetical protein